MPAFFTFLAIVLGVSYLVKKSEFLAGFSIDKKELQRLHFFFKDHFSFYNLLEGSEKHRFLVRVVSIRQKKEMHISAEIKNPQEEVTLLVCAAFAQITFGYEDYELQSFEEVIINPNTFYSKLANHQVKGLTTGTGYIYLSWEHFLKGYISENDKINLALHELAHALYIDRFHYGENYDWESWKELATFTLAELKNNPGHQFFREYGKTNLYEFWAVNVEVFFEDPVNFRALYPGLYVATANVLKQDMASRILLSEETI